MYEIFDPERASSIKPQACAYVSGALFAAAWWILADGAAFARVKDDPQQMTPEVLIPGFISSIGYLLLNSFRWSDMRDDSNRGRMKKCMALFFFSVVCLLAGIGGAIWALVEKWASPKAIADSIWPGLSLLIQTLTLFVAALLLRAGTMSDDH
eukprot:g56973.t1